MRLHFLQHVPFEGPALIGEWAMENGHSVAVTKLYAGDELPRPDTMDWLVVMGGPMGVHDTDEYPWLASEKECIAATLEARKGVLGVCLGAQLVADVLGASVVRNPVKEIGWFPVELSEAGLASPVFAGFPETSHVLHWHGDTFDIPEGAVHAMQSKGCTNQAFVLDEGRVVGLQFHLEMTRGSLSELIANCRSDITPGPYVQDASSMLQSDGFIPANDLLASLLDAMAVRIGGR